MVEKGTLALMVQFVLLREGFGFWKILIPSLTNWKYILWFETCSWTNPVKVGDTGHEYLVEIQNLKACSSLRESAMVDYGKNYVYPFLDP